MKINIEENLIEDGNRNSISIENDLTNFLESNERNSIKIMGLAGASGG